jgi:hypothetical protein
VVNCCKGSAFDQYESVRAHQNSSPSRRDMVNAHPRGHAIEYAFDCAATDAAHLGSWRVALLDVVGGHPLVERRSEYGINIVYNEPDLLRT